jgi:regulator of protease activity HflC (stomatin/prohibitin superfamily)
VAKVVVRPNTAAYLYRKQVYSRSLAPGVYYFLLAGAGTTVYWHTTAECLMDVGSQEVLTKDSIALRFSYLVKYKIESGLELLKNLDLSGPQANLRTILEERLHLESQVLVRNHIAGLASDELNANRSDLLSSVKTALTEQYSSCGVKIISVDAKDITFPKTVQEVFAKHLEAQVRSRADLENARTQVAAARALKNASELMQSDPNIRFVQWLETLTKIASRGNHTFVLGELPQPRLPGQ